MKLISCPLVLAFVLTSRLAPHSVAGQGSFNSTNVFLPTLYSAENDLPDQAAALKNIYYSSGGPQWTPPKLPNLIEYLKSAPPALLSMLLTTPGIPAYQNEQRWINHLWHNASDGISAPLRLALFKIGMAKVQWMTPNTSYCTWVGVICCLTSTDIALYHCSAGLNSIAWLLLPDFGMQGQLPHNLLADLPDLQIIFLPGNPGLIGSFPDMSLEAASYIQVFETSFTGFSQPCSLNSPRWGGSSEEVLVENLSDLNAHKDCLPNFVEFDLSANTRTSLNDLITCPIVKWKIPEKTSSYSTANTTRQRLIGTGTLLELGIYPRMYSFAGCKCYSSDDYTATSFVDKQGERAIECRYTPQARPWVAYVISAAATIGGILVTTVVLTWLFKSSVMRDILVWELNRLKARKAPGTLPLGAGKGLGLVDKEITVIVSDVEGSTDIWEAFPEAMSRALEAHDKLLREILKSHYGYEVTTEGDSFTLSFHDAIDAIGFALHLQERLLEVPWPDEILSNPHACEVLGADGKRLFNGLRVRLAMHTAIPTSVQVHSETKQIEYAGEAVELAECLSRLPAGGQCIISGSTFERILGRLQEIHGLKKQPQALSAWWPGKRDTRSSDTHSIRLPDKRANVTDPTDRLEQVARPSLRLLASDASTMQLISAASSRLTRSFHHHLLGTEDAKVRAGLGLLKPAAGQMDVTIIDQGRFFFLEFDGEHVPTDRPVISGVGALQILPSSLACRSLHFPAINSALQVSPSFFDAPGAAMVQLPGRKISEVQPLSLTIAFCNCCSYKEVAAADLKLAQRALAKYKSCVRTTVRLMAGYECQELNGVYMLAFGSATDAVSWAMLLNLALLEVDWDEDMLANLSLKEVKDAHGRTVLKGMSAAVGIFNGPITKICPHSTTGRADYFGTTVNRASRFLCAAQPGQVLVQTELAHDVANVLQSQTGSRTAGSLAELNYRLLAEDRHKRFASQADAAGLQCSMLKAGDVCASQTTSETLGRTTSNIFRTRSLVPTRSISSSAGFVQNELDTGHLQHDITIEMSANPQQFFRSANSSELQMDSHNNPDLPTGKPFPIAAPSHIPVASTTGQLIPSHLGREANEAHASEAVCVEIFSLGSFTFKGTAGEWQVAQVLPAALAARLALFSHVLKRGKATCTRQDDSRLHSIEMWLPEIAGLRLAR
ncbi:hypothetical protein WJX74_003872 [Apatococcus lobatus]|uniref:Guanylate cyclase domain-containing protein n=1 Tax=Apatococcus lobatus TaxID=904363 RepID=A0AAW1SAD6_9CHLO